VSESNPLEAEVKNLRNRMARAIFGTAFTGSARLD
jgi:hypothetical protein